MSENIHGSTSEAAQDSIIRHALPLSASKKTPWLVWCVIAVVIVVFGINWFLLHYFRPTEKKLRQNDSYVVDTTPISGGASKNKLTPKSLPATNTKTVADKIAQARLRDLMERLKSPQTESSGMGQSSQNTLPNTTSSENSSVLNVANNNGSNPFTISPEQAAKIADPSDQNVLFLTRASTSKAERAFATNFGPLPVVIGQGKFIHGVLETAIDSDLPGQVRAIVTSDVYAEQGSAVLIPRGSRLVGEYKSGLANNQSRLFVVWTRLLEPNGVDIALGSEGTDSIGRAGLAGAVNYHFLARFGAAGLTSLIGAGVSTIGVSAVDQNNSANIYRQQVSTAMAQQANNLLNRDLAIPPTITIPQGQTIAIFVNKDLDFSHVFKV